MDNTLFPNEAAQAANVRQFWAEGQYAVMAHRSSFVKLGVLPNHVLPSASQDSPPLVELKHLE